MVYRCPTCGKNYTVEHPMRQVNCYRCGTTWDTKVVYTGNGAYMAFWCGLMLMPFFPVLGGWLVVGGVIAALRK
jgi:hypothetical protein